MLECENEEEIKKCREHRAESRGRMKKCVSLKYRTVRRISPAYRQAGFRVGVCGGMKKKDRSRKSEDRSVEGMKKKRLMKYKLKI